MPDKVIRAGAYALVTCKEHIVLVEAGQGPYKGMCNLPGGGIEFGESPKETLRRELEEETGITNYEFSKGYQESMYYEFNRGKKERVKKTVVYFLAQAMGNDVKISHEHKNFIWLPFKEAVEKLTFENARDLLRKSEAHLNPHAT